MQQAAVRLGNQKKLSAETSQQGDRVEVTLSQPVEVPVGQILEVELTY